MLHYKKKIIIIKTDMKKGKRTEEKKQEIRNEKWTLTRVIY